MNVSLAGIFVAALVFGLTATAQTAPKTGEPAAKPAPRPTPKPKPAARRTPKKPRKPTKRATPPTPPPAACKAAVDELVTLVSGGLDLLVAEARKREDADLDRGQANFEAYLDDKAAAIAAARATAATVEAGLSDPERGRCDTYAYSAFHKMFVRYASVAGAYHSRIRVFRRLGAVFH